MSGLDANGTPLNNEESHTYRASSNEPVYGQEAPLKKPYKKFIGLGLLACGVLAAAVAFHHYSNWPSHTVNEVSPQTVVAFSADPSVTKDSPIELGYPDHIYSVTCTASLPKDCVLEINTGTGHNTVKRFPYVEQEWFSPGRKNRPYHTLDVILSLPSLNGNADLKMGTNPVKNKQLVQVLQQNGWIAN